MGPPSGKRATQALVLGQLTLWVNLILKGPKKGRAPVGGRLAYVVRRVCRKSTDPTAQRRSLRVERLRSL